MPGIETSLGTLRRKRGISAAHLADAVNVSRQTIYAMEAGTYVPNTAVALRLARTLDTTVEAIFRAGRRRSTGGVSIGAGHFTARVRQSGSRASGAAMPR